MSKNYTEADLKTLVLDQVNNIKGLEAAFDPMQSEEAYDEAVMECGFSIPEITDVDKDRKYHWLIQRMRRWYLGRLLEQYNLRFDAGDLKAQQIVTNLLNTCNKYDSDFAIAKTDNATAHLFINAELGFSSQPLVLKPGFVDDRIGLDRTYLIPGGIY